MGFLTTLGAVIGAVIGFVICSRFRWFGTFKGIVGQYIAFIFVGGMVGSMIVTSIFGSPSKKDTDMDNGDSYYEETEYDEDESDYDEEDTTYEADEDDGSGEGDFDETTENVNRGDAIPELDDDGGGALSGDYIFPESSDVELTDADLEGLTAQELTYARNEIYARHGYVFKSAELNEYFTGKVWYEPDESFDGTLTGLEEANAAFISDYQDANGLTYKPNK